MAAVVSVDSFRGGTGRSNTTSDVGPNLAAPGHQVGVVDCEIQSPGIHVLLGIDETLDRMLNDHRRGTRTIKEVDYDITDRIAVSTPVAKGRSCYVVPSTTRPWDIARIPRERCEVEALIDGTRQHADEVDLDCPFVDTHPGLNDEALPSITLSDALLPIFWPDRQDYRDTAETIAVVPLAGEVVVNASGGLIPFLQPTHPWSQHVSGSAVRLHREARS